MRHIVIAHRRGDATEAARRLSDDLHERNHPNRVVELDTREAGVALRSLAPEAIVLVVVGAHWAESGPSAAIQEALGVAVDGGARVVPVFCGTEDISFEDLPWMLQPRRAAAGAVAFWFTAERWDQELRSLVNVIERPTTSAMIRDVPARAAPSPNMPVDPVAIERLEAERRQRARSEETAVLEAALQREEEQRRLEDLRLHEREAARARAAQESAAAQSAAQEALRQAAWEEQQREIEERQRREADAEEAAFRERERRAAEEEQGRIAAADAMRRQMAEAEALRKEEDAQRRSIEAREARHREEARAAARQVSSAKGKDDDAFSTPDATLVRPGRRVPLEAPSSSAPAPPIPPKLASQPRRGFWRRLTDTLWPEDSQSGHSGYGELKDRARAIPSSDNVTCTVFAPSSVRPGDALLVQVFAHLETDGARAQKLAKTYDSSTSTKGAALLDAPIARGAELVFTLHVPGAMVDDPVQPLVWRGAPEPVQFGVTVPADRNGGNLIGTVSVSDGSVPIGRVKFAVRVVAAPTETETRSKSLPQSWCRFRHAFISYASQDRAEVLKRTQMLDRVGIQLFQDLLSLNPGERWEKSLYKMIDQSDVLFLFWSSHAKASEWVLKEVRYALDRHAGDDMAPPEIIPVPLEGPPPVLPPPELRELHFNDRFLYFIAGSQSGT